MKCVAVWFGATVSSCVRKSKIQIDSLDVEHLFLLFVKDLGVYLYSSTPLICS